MRQEEGTRQEARNTKQDKDILKVYQFSYDLIENLKKLLKINKEG